jgi:hypothetical protein
MTARIPDISQLTRQALEESNNYNNTQKELLLPGKIHFEKRRVSDNTLRKDDKLINENELSSRMFE